MITSHRALSLAIASLGDTSRILDTCAPENRVLASEVREARDHLIALRDNSTVPLQAIKRNEPSTTENCS